MLSEGENIVVLTAGTAYKGWYYSFMISPTAAKCARTVEYDGKTTARYGLESYAEVNGPAWVTGDGAEDVKYGKSSRIFGSNPGDNRDNMSMTFSVNAAQAGSAFLLLYVREVTSSESIVSVSVNDGAAASVNLKDTKGGAKMDHAPSHIPVNLIQGDNKIVVTTSAAYKGWFRSFALSAIDFSKSDEPIGDMTANGASIGVNAFDNAADYGKTGSVTLTAKAPTAGKYTFGFKVMAGNPLANRVKFTLNGTVMQFGGKDYYGFDTAAGWGGNTWNYIDADLIQGDNTLKIENSLTRVNADKDAEAAEGAADSVLVSNWWINEISVAEKPTVALILDTANVQKAYNRGRTVNTDGLVVKYSVDGEESVLSANDYTVSLPTLDNSDSKNVVVTHTASGLTASYSVSVTDQGLPFDGKTVDFDGVTSTGAKSYYANAKLSGQTEGAQKDRLFYAMYSQATADNGYVIGSNGEGANENRQLTLTVKINNTGAKGTYLFKSSANAHNYMLNFAAIAVNDGTPREVNLCSAMQGSKIYPYTFEVELESGMNTVEIATKAQYSIWWYTFEVSPVEYSDKNEFTTADGVRGGIDCYDTGNDKWLGSEDSKSLKFFVATTDSTYRYTFITEKLAGKSFKLKFDGGEAQTVALDASGTTSIKKQLTAGNHSVEILCDGGAGSDFDFMKMQLTELLPILSLECNTDGLTAEIEYGSKIDLKNLVVTASFAGGSRVLEASEYTVELPANYELTVGIHTATIKSADFPQATSATFTFTVKDSGAQAVIDMIEALNTSYAEITSDNLAAAKTARDAARTAYDKLHATAKANVTNYDKLGAFSAKIAAYEKGVADKASAKVVADKIAALPNVITKANKDEVAAVKNAYDALTSDQKALISDELKAKLDKAVKDSDKDDAKGCAGFVLSGAFPAAVLLLIVAFAFTKRKKIKAN